MVLIYKKGDHWYNNGVVNKKAFSCPQGWVEGKLTNSLNLKKVKCIETGKIYFLRDVMFAYKAIRGVNKTAKGYHWKYI